MKVILSATLGKDAESKQDENGKFIITFSCAENQTVKGEQVTNWYNALYVSKSDKVCEYLTKGTRVLIFGELNIETYRSEQTGNVNISRSLFVRDLDILVFKRDIPMPEQQEQTNAVKENGDIPF